MDKLLLFSSCVIAVIADMLLVWWSKRAEHPSWAIILGMVLINITSITWTLSMKRGIESATAITFYALFTVAGCSFLGFVVFGETLTTTNAVGIILALVALALIGL